MAATVEDMIDNILRREGGYVWHEADRGGPTNFGVTLATLRRWRGDPTLTAADVRALTRDEAREIYRSDYLGEPGIDRLPQSLQLQLFDMSINHGPSKVVQLLQEVLDALGTHVVAVDGAIGPQTVNAAYRSVRKRSEVEVNNAVARRQVRFYEAIVDSRPSQRVFLKGWLRRAREFVRELPQRVQRAIATPKRRPDPKPEPRGPLARIRDRLRQVFS